MSDQDMVRNVPAALHAMLARCAGETDPGRRTQEPAMLGSDVGVVPNQDALETDADASGEVMMLRTQQQYALEDLIAGKTQIDAARTAGVSPRTLSRWMNDDPAFRAALEAWRRKTVRTVEDRLMQATEVAANTLAGAAARDFRAAALLLKGRGMLPGAARQFKPIEKNPLVLAVPPGKRRDFEVRLRELILSFKDEPGSGEGEEGRGDGETRGRGEGDAGRGGRGEVMGGERGDAVMREVKERPGDGETRGRGEGDVVSEDDEMDERWEKIWEGV